MHSPDIFHKGTPWRQYQNILIPDTAPHENVVVTPEDCQVLLQGSSAHLLRWHSHFDHPVATPFWHVIKDSSSSLDELSSNTRNQIRRGFKHCRTAATTASYIAENGYDVYRKAFERYQTFINPQCEQDFQSGIRALATEPSWEFWGVWDLDETLIGYSQNKIQGETCNYSTIKFHPGFLKYYPSYVLFFEMNNHYLNQRKLRYVNDGARSISHVTNVQDFLIGKFKFRKAYSRLHVAYNSRVGVGVRLLYPFRSLVFKLQGSYAEKAGVLLRQEEIVRGCGEMDKGQDR